LTGTAAIKAASKEIGIVTQNRRFVSPAFIAPGTIAMTVLSVISMATIESVSATSTTESACFRVKPFLSSGKVDKLYPNINANTIDITIVEPLLKPIAVPIISPRISPIAQPVKQ
jgi:hypothetical protein